MYLMRVRYFGGYLTRTSYKIKKYIARIIFVLFGTLCPTVNLIVIYCEVYAPEYKAKLGLAVLCFYMGSAVAQFLVYLITGTLLIVNLHTCFENKYDKISNSLKNGLWYIIGALSILITRESIEYLFLFRVIRVQDGNTWNE